MLYLTSIPQQKNCPFGLGGRLTAAAVGRWSEPKATALKVPVFWCQNACRKHQIQGKGIIIGGGGRWCYWPDFFSQ